MTCAANRRLYRFVGRARPELYGRQCHVVYRPDGRCCKSRLGTILIEFADNGQRENVLYRLLRRAHQS